MRPTMGGPGIPQIPRGGNQGSGTMGILMPLYTTGIVIFFVYTVMRIMFKKNDESSDNDDRTNPRRLHQQLRSQTIPHEYLQPQRPPQQPQMAAVKKSPPKPQKVEEIKAKSVKKNEAKIEPIKESETKPAQAESTDPRDEEIMILKQRLEETEKAMQMVVSHMAALTSQMKPPEKEQPENIDNKDKVPNKDSENENDSESSDNEEENETNENSDDAQSNEKIESLSSSVPIAQES